MAEHIERIPDATKEKWLPLLESGTLKQANGLLFNDETHGYCCLGVYAKACGARFFREEYDDGIDEEGKPVVALSGEMTIEVDDFCGDLNDNELLSQQWATANGISDAAQRLLSALNDGGQHSIRHDDPLYAVWIKHAEPERTETTVATRPATALAIKQRRFAEIAKVIREDL